MSDSQEFYVRLQGGFYAIPFDLVERVEVKVRGLEHIQLIVHPVAMSPRSISLNWRAS